MYLVGTEDCKLVVRLQMRSTLGVVVIGQLDELVSTCGNSTACCLLNQEACCSLLLYLASLFPPPPPPPPPSNTPLEEACSATQNTLINISERSH